MGKKGELIMEKVQKLTITFLAAMLLLAFTVKPGSSQTETQTAITPTGSQEESMNESKVHLVYLGESFATESYVFKPIERANLKGVECVGGLYAKPGYWCSGKRVYIPVDKVKVIVEFDSLDDYENSIKEYMKQRQSQMEGYYRVNR